MKKKFIPSHKDDFKSIKILEETTLDEFFPHITELLSWIQDMNWPIAKELACFLALYVNEIQNEIVDILKGEDDIWEYWCMKALLFDDSLNPSKKLMSELTRLASNPTDGEREEECDLLAEDVLNSLNNQ